LKNLSRSKTQEKVENLREKTAELDIFETIKQCVKTIIEFTYDDIVKKRNQASNDLYDFISESIDFSKEELNKRQIQYNYSGYWYNYKFKEEMYYYFNAKYARSNYLIKGKPHSLLDDTEKGTISNWSIFDKYANLLNDQNRFIAECKMIRGSCRKIWRNLAREDYKNEYTLKILFAYSTFALNNELYYKQAEDYLVDGFLILAKQSDDYEYIEKCFSSFEDYINSATNDESFINYLLIAKHRVMLETLNVFSKNLIESINI